MGNSADMEMIKKLIQLGTEVARLQSVNAELVYALDKLLLAADNSNCDSTACMNARSALAKARGE